MQAGQSISIETKPLSRMHHFIFFLLVFYVKMGHGEIQPTVCLEDSGDCYMGSWSTKDIGFASFQGIRYAQPPIGDLRFKPPEPLKPHSRPENFKKSRQKTRQIK